jgi:beta-lactam-binding protein with PASTA domain
MVSSSLQVAVPIGVFFVVIIVSVAWMLTLYVKSKVSEAAKVKEQQEKAAKLKARS